MQFAVPQFTDVEDKLIGPLTLKQFLILMGTGGIVLFFYSILKISIFFFFFAAPFIILGLALAFGKFNGRPLYSYGGVFLSYISRPQVRIFHREEPIVVISIQKEKKPVTATVVSGEENESRLKKIAYLLDQKSAEEKVLLDK